MSHHSKTKDPKENVVVNYCVISSPVGKLLLAGKRDALMVVSFLQGNHPIQPEDDWVANPQPFQTAIQQLKEYFAGTRQTFTIPIAPEGTPFQRKVWEALRIIPYGTTVSYRDIAKAIGQPNACRAVGAANGKNPVSIIVPCHRVIGQTGKLVGYGGGLPIKKALLALEAKHQGNRR